MNIFFKKSIQVSTAFLVAFNVVFAAASDFKDFVYGILIGKILSPLTVLVISLIIMYFFFNSAMYLFKSNKSSEERKKVMESLMWSVIILLILFSVWGIVRMLAATLSIDVAI